MTRDEKKEIINADVTLRDIITAYGLDGGNPRGRIPCPFHRGKNRDAFSFNDRLYQCWNCGASGDLIRFVEQYEELDYSSALDRIGALFGLWEEGKELSFSQKMRIKKAKRDREIARKKKERAQARYFSVWDKWFQADAACIRYAPTNPDDEWDDRFAEACYNLEIAAYETEMLIKESG